jgi:hypothetical protein
MTLLVDNEHIDGDEIDTRPEDRLLDLGLRLRLGLSVALRCGIERRAKGEKREYGAQRALHGMLLGG